MKVKDLRAQLNGLDDDLEIYEFARNENEIITKADKNTVFAFVSNLNNGQQYFSFDESDFYKHKVLILI